MNSDSICKNYGTCIEKNNTKLSNNHPLHSKIRSIRIESSQLESNLELSLNGDNDRNSSDATDSITRSKRKQEVDGFQAWLTLTCIFIMNATTLGSLKVYGLIYEEIVAQGYYSREQASWSISTATTVQNLAGLLTPILALKLSWRLIEIMQTTLLVLANIGAYFSSGLALDIFLLGIVQGVALSLRYNMNIVVNNEYFYKYRATAMGISLAGSTCGVFFLKPIITWVLDNSEHQFRQAYVAIGLIMSSNFVFNLLIRKPRHTQSCSQTSIDNEAVDVTENTNNIHRISSVRHSIVLLIKSPSLHCVWIMQTIYFYISRTYTIFIVDYGVDVGLERDDSRNLLDFWVYGELLGRFLLGGIIDSRLLSLKCCIIIVNALLAIGGFSLIMEPKFMSIQHPPANSSSNDLSLNSQQLYFGEAPLFWFIGVSVASVAALSSLVNMLIVPFGQEYLGRKSVPWAFAVASFITSIFLLARPVLIGLSRDNNKSYDILIIVMSTAPLIYAILFAIFEPLLKRFGIVSCSFE